MPKKSERTFNRARIVASLNGPVRSLGELQDHKTKYEKRREKRPKHDKPLILDYPYYAMHDGNLIGFKGQPDRERFLKWNGGVKIGNAVARAIYEELGLATRSLDVGVE